MKEFDNSFEPEIGKFYLVKCAKMLNQHTRNIHYIPVIGEKHKDAEFGVNWNHYHIDGRFTDKKIDVIYSVSKGHTNIVLTTERKDYPNMFQGLEFRKKKCQRNTTGVEPPANVKKYWDWRISMTGKKVKNGICPHRGIKMLDKGEVLVCPLHGLVACKNKMEIIESCNPK